MDKPKKNELPFAAIFACAACVFLLIAPLVEKPANEKNEQVATAIYRTLEGDIIETEITWVSNRNNKGTVELKTIDGTFLQLPAKDIIIYKNCETNLPEEEYQSDITLKMPDNTLQHLKGTCSETYKFNILGTQYQSIDITGMHRIRTATQEYYAIADNINATRKPSKN